MVTNQLSLLFNKYQIYFLQLVKPFKYNKRAEKSYQASKGQMLEEPMVAVSR